MAEGAREPADSPGSSGEPPARPPGAAPGKLPIDLLVRSVAAIAATFYVVGFLTTNAYLYVIGVADFSLLRTRFVLTGVLTLAPLALALITGIYVALDASVTGEDRSPRRTALAVLVDIAVPFALYFALFSILAENDAATSARDAALLTVICAAIVLVALAALAAFRRAERRPLRRFVYGGGDVAYERFKTRFGVPDAAVEGSLFAVVGTLVLLLYIGLFGQYFYPRIPEQLGGGRPRLAQLLIADGAVPAVQELGIPVTADNPLSPPLQLLWVGEETYVIRLPGPHQGSVAQIANGLVAGVVTGREITLAAP